MDTASQPRASLFSAWPPNRLGAVLLTTYTFEPHFFEGCLLRELINRGAFPIAVFVDRQKGYHSLLERAGSLSAAGRLYHVFPYDAGRHCFHPKVHLFTGPGVAMVGSGNLTPSGCGGNLEAFDLLTRQDDGDAVASVRQFFRQILRSPAVAGAEEARNWFLEHLDKKQDPVGGNAAFLHSLAGATLWDQFEYQLDGKQYDTALLAAPFHAPAHTITRDVAALLGATAVQVASDPELVGPAQLDATTGILDDERSRRLHAKVIHAVGPAGQLSVVGSANLTEAAWRGGNIEAVVVRRRDGASAPGGSAGAASWRPAAMFKPADWCGKLPTLTHEPEPGDPGCSIRLARLHNAVLEVTFVGSGDGLDFAVLHAGRRTGVSLMPDADNIWRGEFHATATGTVLVTASRDGHEVACALVDQVDCLVLRPEHWEVQNILDAAKSGKLSTVQEIVLVSHLNRALREACARADVILAGVPIGGSDPNQPTGGAKAQRIITVSTQVPNLDGGHGAAGDQALLGRKIIEALFGRSLAGRPRTRNGDTERWNADQDEMDDAEGGDDRPLGGSPETPGVDRNSSGDAGDALPSQIVQAGTRHAREVREALPALVRSGDNDAIQFLDTATGLLCDLMAKHPQHGSLIAQYLVELVAAGWSKGGLTSRNPVGVFLKHPHITAAAIAGTEAALLCAIPYLTDARALTMDQARLSLRGLETHPSRSEPIDLATVEHPAAAILQHYDWAKVRDDLRQSPTLDDVAIKELAPLIELHQVYQRRVHAERRAIPGDAQACAVLATAESAYAHALASVRTTVVHCPERTYLGNLWRRALSACGDGLTDPVVILRDNLCVCGATAPAMVVAALHSPENIRCCAGCQRILVAGLPEDLT